MPDYLDLSPEVRAALEEGRPVVALETTVIAHGLPYPHNMEAARRCDAAVRAAGAIPATIGLIAGRIQVGVNEEQLLLLATRKDVRKVSRRDFGIAIAGREHGATTVSGTLISAHLAGIRVLATGGIGGVHRGNTGDVSADLPDLARTPLAVVCSGAKAILDLPRTLEYLETLGVPILGFQTDQFPAFYAISSGLPVDLCVDKAEQVVDILRAHWGAGLQSGVLVAVPPPAEVALDPEDMERAVQRALSEAEQAGVAGKALTPFLRGRSSELTEGRSLQTNLALLEHNAGVAARIACALLE